MLVTFHSQFIFADSFKYKGKYFRGRSGHGVGILLKVWENQEGEERSQEDCAYKLDTCDAESTLSKNQTNIIILMRRSILPYFLTLLNRECTRRIIIIFWIVRLNHNESRCDLRQKKYKTQDESEGVHCQCSFLYMG